jgi:hypothetical protein
MSRRPVSGLPDLEDDDADFHRRMSPLLEQALPEDRKPNKPDNRLSGKPDIDTTGLMGAARQQARIEAARGSKRRFEYLIPERVGRALAADASARGVSATTRLLEVLRDAGYPVIDEDLIDLRKMPRR